MDLKFRGQKYLNDNTYEYILISNEKRQKDYLAVTAKTDRFKHIQMQETSTPEFLTYIKNLDSYEQITETIKYFLRNNTICHIDTVEGIIVYSMDGRKLNFKASLMMDNIKRLKDIPQLIKDKYQNDRYRFLDNNEVISKYIIRGEEYMDYHRNNNEIIISLLENKFGILVEWEDKFLMEFIEEKLFSRGEYIQLDTARSCNFDNGGSYCVPAFILRSGDLIVDIQGISKEYKSKIKEMIMEYNNNLFNEKELQLKLEGIK